MIHVGEIKNNKDDTIERIKAWVERSNNRDVSAKLAIYYIGKIIESHEEKIDADA